MAGRPESPIAEIRAGRYAWAATIPWLPDLLSSPGSVTLTGSPIREAFGRQIAFLRAVIAGAPRGTSLQLRFLARPVEGTIECQLIGAGNDPADVRALNQIVLTALPAEYPLESIPADQVRISLDTVGTDRMTGKHVAEIRRAVDRLDPSLEDSYSDDPVLFPWVWSAQALLNSLNQLRLQAAETVLIVHLEPTDFPPDIATFLQDEVRRLLADLKSGEENPLGVAVLQGYRRWLRLLPKGCAKLRLMVAGNAPLTPGLAEALSTDLTRSFEAGTDSWFGTAAVLKPQTPGEIDACAAMLDEVRGVAWGDPRDSDLTRLSYLFEPLEANTAFRLPISPSGGLAGVASQRLSTLSRARNPVSASEGSSIELGTTITGDRLKLSAADLNRHVLVAGLPGFGKSSTVQLLLRRTFEELRVPFLVLDPSKQDYRVLFDELASEGHPVNVVRLTPRAVAFNPLAVPEGVDHFAHAGRVLAAFDSAFNLSEQWPLAHLELVRTLYALYDDPSQPPPTLRELYRAVGASIRDSSFSGEARSNLEGSLLGRLEYLSNGPAGRSLLGDRAAAIDWADIMSKPTLIELGAFTGPSERALMFGLLIAGLVSYVEANPGSGGLRHLTVLEEAHRLLRPSGSRDSGVETFVDAIAELRSAGEGFVIVDQAPSSLHPGIQKLTSTKIIHRVVEEDERRSLGASMVLDQSQIDDLARLASQRAVVYAATATEAAMIDVDRLTRTSSPPATVVESLVPGGGMTPVHCIKCPHICRGSDGLAELSAFVTREDVDWASPRSIIRSAAVAVDGKREAAYCLAAAAVATRGAENAGSSRIELDRVRSTYDQMLRERARREKEQAST